MEHLSAWLALHFCIAVAGTWLARHYAVRQQLIDEPGERRSHAVATPRGGGIAIVLSLGLAAAWLAWRSPADAPLLMAFEAGLWLIALVGWWDDHRPLSAGLRLVVHAVAASIFAGTLGGATGNWWLAAAAFLAILVLVNVWNFMDGINGIATSQAAIAALAGLLLLSGAWAWLAGALLAACLGFLPFNFPRARIFLGDVGSGALGFALAALLSAGLARQPPQWLMLAPLLVFLVDAGFTLAARILRREAWWSAHVTHVYQRAARRFGHLAVTSAYALLNGVTLSLILVVSNGERNTVQFAWLAGAIVFMLALWGWARKGLK